MNRKEFSSVGSLCNKLKEYSAVDPSLYEKFHVKRGLRKSDGTGVTAGITKICNVHGYLMNEGEVEPIPGELIYRGYNINDLVSNVEKEGRYGFEEVVYLLLFGNLPSKTELESFRKYLAESRELPDNFAEDMILKAPSRNIMNKMSRSVLALYSYDVNGEDTSLEAEMNKAVNLIAKLPVIMTFAYQVQQRHYYNKSMIIHPCRSEEGTAQTILSLLRRDREYTPEEAHILDILLMLHAEHGGGNNSTFTTHVVSSSGTDTYSSTAASLGSLKGPKHGGANIKVVQMFDDLMNNIDDWTDEQAIREYLTALLEKRGFDKSGLIYGMGHAVYSISDPRARVLKKFVKELSIEKGMEKEYELYKLVERLAPEVISEKRKIYKGVSANIDFYSGLIYRMLGLPSELYTPIFAIARISGWSAHRIEELINAGKIIRPAYKAVAERTPYTKMADR